MDPRLVKAAIDGDVTTLHNLLEEDPQILQKASSLHFADSPLHVAARSGKADFVEQIVSRKPSLATETNQQGMIPLHLAALEGHVETVRELLKANLDDDGMNQCLLKDEEGWTALHCASQKGKIRVMEELISKCPQSLEQVTAKGETVLHLAVKANQVEAAKVLVERIKRLPKFQTLLKAQGQKGKSAYQLAAAKEQLQVLEVLKEDDEIREGHRINVEGEGSDHEASGKEESKESQSSQEEAILVVAALVITLTYQALLNPPSIFLKDGSIIAEWICLSPIDKRMQSGRKEDCSLARLPSLFLILNTMIFLQSIYVVVSTLRGPRIVPVTVITLYLVACYSILLVAVSHHFAYLAMLYGAIMAAVLIITKHVNLRRIRQIIGN